MEEKTLNKKAVYKKVVNIGLPVAIENMIYALMNFVDMFMVGKEIVALGLGTVAVAGLGFANHKISGQLSLFIRAMVSTTSCRPLMRA